MTQLIPATKTFNGQFRVSLTPEGWPCEAALNHSLELTGVWIHYDGLATEHRLYDGDRKLIGAFIGVLIDPQASEVVNGSVDLEIAVDDEEFVRLLEDRIYRFSGCWILILAIPGLRRIYLDPCGSLSVVYSAEKALAGSTAGVLLSDQEYVSHYQRDLHKRLGVAQSGWFPGGMTAHRGVRRVLANHYLDLETWLLHRHWPLHDFTEMPLNQGAAQIAKLIKASVEALYKDGPTVLAITGGKDSRLLLAACRDCLPGIDLATIGLPGSERDVHIARKLAGIDPTMHHQVLKPIRASGEERTRWLYNASHCLGGVNQFYSPSLAPLTGYKYFLSGAAGEIGRAFLWRASDAADSRIEARELIARLGLRFNLELEDDLVAWLKGVRDLDFFTVLDLAYLELRVSSWAFAQSYAYVGKGYMTQITPFNNRELIAILCSLHPDHRRSEAYIQEGIQTLWPALLGVPFNRYGGLKDCWELIRPLTDPVRVASKLRKLVLGKFHPWLSS